MSKNLKSMMIPELSAVLKDMGQPSFRAKQVYTELVSAAEELLVLVKTRMGKTNKENAKLTAQIRSLIEKWKE